MTLSLPTPTAEIQVALQRAMDLVAFGLHAAESADPSDLSLPGVTSQITTAPDRVLDVASARTEFRSWVLTNGLRDAVEAIGPALEWARKTCFLWTRQGSATKVDDKFHLSATMTGAEWNAGIVTAALKFDRLPLPNKLEHLEQEYGLAKLELADQILSINAARNCLSHRKGIVGPLDLKDSTDSELVVRWRKLQLSVTGVDGSARVLTIPANVEAGETLLVGFVDTERRFPLGEMVSFSATEFVELCYTFSFFALQIEASILALQTSRVETRTEESAPTSGNQEDRELGV